jgi:2,4-dienoyl-CoA reductase-like NADH-dependent reductase (Old Yellow Enzyme family)
MARDPRHDILFEPIKIGPKLSRNRFWQTAHCAGPGSERPGAQAHLRGMRAEGGWGVVFTEYCSIHPEADEYPYTSARIWDDGDVRNLGYMCAVAHRHGSLAGIQLWYSGGNAPSLESREFGRSPSQWLSPLFASRSVYGTEMDESDIAAVIRMYVEAGKRALQAGFDVLEVSAGDDTVPIQFLEPRFNRRTDRYGGSFENRSRFFIELLHALKRELGANSAITTRFEMDTLHGPDGVEAHEDGVRLLELFRREGVVDLVALKIGDYAEWGEDAGVSRFRKSGWMTPFIKQGKAILGADIPVVGNGRLTSPDDMVALLRAGVLDIVGAARPSIADPFLPVKISEGRLADIRECIGCNICVSKFQQGGQIMCTQNGKPVPGRRILVLDGDGHFMGITLAELMADRGKHVTYMCDAPHVAEYGVFTMESFNNKRMLFEKGIGVRPSHWALAIEPGRVRVGYLYKYGPDLLGPSAGAIPRKDNGGDFDLEIDAVILVTSRRSDDTLWRELKARRAEWAANEIEDVFRTGDCKAPAQLTQAIWDAHRLAREFDSPHPACPLPWIRERQLWGAPTVPKLGDARVDVEAATAAVRT